MALIQPSSSLNKSNQWQLVLVNNSNQLVLYNDSSKSLTVKNVEVNNVNKNNDKRVCPTCLRPFIELNDIVHDDNKPSPNHYFKLLMSLSDASNNDDIYTSNENDVNSRVDGYYEKFFIEQSQIGRGSYASVHLCQHTINGNLLGHYAVKKIAVGLSNTYLRNALQG